MTNNPELQSNNPEIQQYRELSKHYVVALRKLVEKFVKKYPKYNYKIGNLYKLIMGVEILENEFNEKLNELNFSHNKDIKTYQAWCLLDNVRAALESATRVTEFDPNRESFMERNPQGLIEDVVSMIENFHLE